MVIVISSDCVLFVFTRWSAVRCRCWQWRLHSAQVQSRTDSWHFVTIDVNNQLIAQTNCCTCYCSR